MRYSRQYKCRAEFRWPASLLASLAQRMPAGLQPRFWRLATPNWNNACNKPGSPTLRTFAKRIGRCRPNWGETRVESPSLGNRDHHAIRIWHRRLSNRILLRPGLRSNESRRRFAHFATQETRLVAGLNCHCRRSSPVGRLDRSLQKRPASGTARILAGPSHLVITGIARNAEMDPW